MNMRTFPYISLWIGSLRSGGIPKQSMIQMWCIQCDIHPLMCCLFLDNNKHLIKTHHIEINDNNQSAFHFGTYSYPRLYGFNVGDSNDKIIDLNDAKATYIKGHYVEGHKGNYVRYQAKTTTISHEEIVIQSGLFMYNDVTSEIDSENAIIFVDGAFSKIVTLDMIFTNITYRNNQIPFLTVNRGDYDLYDTTLSSEIFYQYVQCPLPSTAQDYSYQGQLEMYLSTFTHNKPDYLFQTKFYNIFIERSVFHDNQCKEYCMTNLDSALTISASSIPSNQPSFIQFGHESNNISDYNQYKIGHNPLCFYYMDKFNTTTQFSLLNFGPENGTIYYLPCNEFNSTQFPSSLFSKEYDSILPTKVFAQSGGFLLDAYHCPESRNTSADECHIECTTSVSCFASQFLLNSTTQSTMKCAEKFACSFSQIYSKSPQFSVLCETEASCKGAFIHANVDNFTLECISTDSCSEIILWIINTTSANIICYELGITICLSSVQALNKNDLFIIHHTQRKFL